MPHAIHPIHCPTFLYVLRHRTPHPLPQHSKPFHPLGMFALYPSPAPSSDCRCTRDPDPTCFLHTHLLFLLSLDLHSTTRLYFPSSFASFSAATLARLWLPLGFLCDLNFEACATSDLLFEDFVVASIKYQILAILSQLAPWVISEKFFMYRARCTL